MTLTTEQTEKIDRALAHARRADKLDAGDRHIMDLVSILGETAEYRSPADRVKGETDEDRDPE